MFYSSSQDRPPDGAPPPPALLDFALPDSLRRARHAALAALAPALTARGWTEPKFLLLRALVQAGEPLSQTEAAARAGLAIGAILHDHIRHLVRDGYIEWRAPPKTFGYSKICARDIGRRQVNHIAREAAKHIAHDGGAADWAALAALPPEIRVTERMRTRLFALSTKLRRACAREPVLEHANAEQDDSGDLVFGLALEMRRTRSALVKRLGTSLRAHRFGEAQWRILRILAQSPGAGWSLKGLGRRGCFHFSDPTVRYALVSLQTRGLVRRSAVLRPLAWRVEQKKPQRKFLAEITQAGLAMIERIEAQQRIDNADLFARLPDAEMMQLERLLARVTVALLWREGLAAEEQATHPFAAQYDRFDSYVKDAARAHARQNRILKANGLAVRTKPGTKWWD